MMNRAFSARSMRSIAMTVLILAQGGAAIAHHSAAMFDASKTLALAGTVEKWKFVNPHSWLYLAVTDATGKTVVWELEGGSPSHMARAGWKYTTLKPGDKITAAVNPKLDGTASGAFRNVTLADGTVMGTMPVAAGRY